MQQRKTFMLINFVPFYLLLIHCALAQIVGKYQHEKNENLDAFYEAVGIPGLSRKILTSTKPQLEISVDKSQQWNITISSFLRLTSKFKLGEEYEEDIPGGIVAKSTTIIEDDKLKTTSISPDIGKILRTYECNNTLCIITMKHEQSGKEAKRYFKRIAS
ncbi:hypothetical protein ILUMI_12075 [Ignelater luminosus]|uniref:Uncharacterized protein n=1 Tax=Ignelater luminosus TaxID=2038154 RepID=A0A8K0D3N3_IGNLU|nr:hypothetical protein ILUMI_12075 [Ignelater luminosus]